MFQLRGDKRLLQPGMKAPFDRDRCTEKRGNGRRMRRNRLFEIPCNLVRLVEKRLNRSRVSERKTEPGCMHVTFVHPVWFWPRVYGYI